MLYTFAAVAFRGEKFILKTGCIEVSTEQEAREAAMSRIIKRCPIEEGYRKHTITIQEIKIKNGIQIFRQGD